MREELVLDASAAVALTDDADPETLSRWHRVLRADEIHVPSEFDAEVAESLRKQHRRDPAQAREFARSLDGLPTRRWGWADLRDRVWELASNVSIYDAQYLAVAELTGATFVTRDRRLSRAPGVRCEVEVW